jgi:hypothetical protein
MVVVFSALLDAAGPDVALLEGVLLGLPELPQAAIVTAAAASPASPSHLFVIVCSPLITG